MLRCSSSSYPQRHPGLESLPFCVLNLLVSLGLGFLSHFEHTKSIRPSPLIGFYLLTSLFFDIARTRTRFLLHSSSPIAALLTALVMVKAVVLVIEAVSKRGILLDAWKGVARESTSGIFCRGFFPWLNNLLARAGKAFSVSMIWVLWTDAWRVAGWVINCNCAGSPTTRHESKHLRYRHWSC